MPDCLGFGGLGSGGLVSGGLGSGSLGSGGLGLSDARQESLNQRLDAWAARFGCNFVLGLSGGGDSMALALGCARWMQLGHGRVRAVCVDHGLRENSAAEALQTMIWAKAIGLSAVTVSLNLPPTASRLQERARQARHEALLSEAKAISARIILLGHTRDDQNETVALRLASKTGLDGLAGMSPLSSSPFYGDDWPCLLGRPLLNTSRQELRHDLNNAGQSWHEDPSNMNSAFARIRARGRLYAFSSAKVDCDKLSLIADHAGVLRALTDRAARDTLFSADLDISPDRISVSKSSLATASIMTTRRILGWLAFAVGGAPRLPEGPKIARLYDAIQHTEFRGATLAGAKFMCRGDRMIIARAPVRRGATPPALHKNRDIKLRLRAMSGNLEQFVTYLE